MATVESWVKPKVMQQINALGEVTHIFCDHCDQWHPHYEFEQREITAGRFTWEPDWCLKKWKDFENNPDSFFECDSVRDD